MTVIWLLLAAALSDDRACQLDAKPVPYVYVSVEGEACAPPPAEAYVQAWTDDGAWMMGFQIPWKKPSAPVGFRPYEPSAVWMTAEGASACMKGMRLQVDGVCAGVYRLRCAARTYQLRVVESGVTIFIHRSMRRAESQKLRCESTIEFNPNVQYTNGESIVVSIFEGKDAICWRGLDLEQLSDLLFEDVYDTKTQKWLQSDRFQPPGSANERTYRGHKTKLSRITLQATRVQ